MASTPERDAPGGATTTANSGRDLINSLPDGCLVDIFSRVVPETLPTTMSNLAVQHPIHCALVCRRWAALADASVTHLHIQRKRTEWSLPTSLGQRLTRFSALRSLHFIDFIHCDGMSPILRALSLGACPLLSSLHYAEKAFPGLDGADLAGALRHCTLLQDLNVLVRPMRDAGDLRLAIRGLPLLESLNLDIRNEVGRGLYELGGGLQLHDVHQGMLQLRSLGIRSFDQSIPEVSFAEGLPLLEKLALSFEMPTEPPVSLGRLSTLRSLNLSCVSSIPASLGQLHNLRILDINRCGPLEFLPESLGALSALESLSLSHFYGLRELPTSLGSLSALMRLFIQTCQSLNSLPDSFSRLTSLETLTVGQGCYAIQTLPQTLGSLQRLTALAIDAESLTRIPESIGLLTGLRSLSLNGPSLTQLQASLGRLSALEKLAICDDVAFPEQLGDLTALREVTLRDCTRIPESLGRLQTLVSLVVCWDGGILAEGIERLTRLQELRLHTNYAAQLPDCLLRMPSLQRVSLSTNMHVENGHPSLAVLDKLHVQGVFVERNFHLQ